MFFAAPEVHAAGHFVEAHAVGLPPFIRGRRAWPCRSPCRTSSCTRPIVSNSLTPGLFVRIIVALQDVLPAIVDVVGDRPCCASSCCRRRRHASRSCRRSSCRSTFALSLSLTDEAAEEGVALVELIETGVPAEHPAGVTVVHSFNLVRGQSTRVGERLAVVHRVASACGRSCRCAGSLRSRSGVKK